MMVKSNDFESEGILPVKFTCDGENVSPHLNGPMYQRELRVLHFYFKAGANQFMVVSIG
ncbi:MAG: hypothetical protein ACETWM_19590 [Candidatus Lokiarchaeia archaeon]